MSKPSQAPRAKLVRPKGLLRRLWYQFIRSLLAAALILGCSMRIAGGANLRRQGALLVLANHQSFIDPGAIGVVSPRPLCFLARKTLFRNPFFAWLISSLNAAPIDQEGIGIDGLRTVLQLLGEGEAVVVFPEGERTPDGEFCPLKSGVLLLLRKMPVPVVPVGIVGAYEAWPRWRAYPTLSPLFLPAGNSTIAVYVGKAVDTTRLAKLPREQALAELFAVIKHVYERAEKLRRK